MLHGSRQAVTSGEMSQQGGGGYRAVHGERRGDSGGDVRGGVAASEPYIWGCTWAMPGTHGSISDVSLGFRV